MSVSISFEVLGVDDFARALNRFDKAMQSRIQEQLSRWAVSVKVDAERLVPVRTGYLQSSIYARSQGWQVEVGAEAAYASAVEFGTSNMRSQPYLNPAVQAQLPNLENVLLSALDLAKVEAEL